MRAGDSAELIAAETDWPLDKVLRYAEPLLAERAFVAEQAQSVEVRRTGGSTTLLESAAGALGRPTDDAEILWDAFRREDGKWVVTADYVDDRGRRRAAWTYDPTGRNLHALDDDARELMGARPVAVPSVEDDIADALDLVADIPVVRADAADMRPHLVAVPDVVEIVETIEVVEVVEIVEFDAVDAVDDGTFIDDVDIVVSADTFDDIETVDDIAAVRSDTETVALPIPTPAASQAKAARKPKSRKGRASVPSWDEILFGASTPGEAE